MALQSAFGKIPFNYLVYDLRHLNYYCTNLPIAISTSPFALALPKLDISVLTKMHEQKVE